MKYKDNGQFKPIYVKALDSMPVGTEVDFDGQASDIPVGWEQVEDKGEVYSTTEQRIGTWVDGKPLYKATIYISSLPNRTATNYNHNIENIDKVYGIEGVLQGVYEGNYYFEPIVNMNAGNISATACGISVSRTAISILSQNTDRSSNSAYITIRYTKTTDQGGNA